MFKFDTVHFQQLLFCLYICCPCLFNQSFICSLSVILHLLQKLLFGKSWHVSVQTKYFEICCVCPGQVRSKSALKFKKSNQIKTPSNCPPEVIRSTTILRLCRKYLREGEAVQGHNNNITITKTIISFCISICNSIHFQNKHTILNTSKTNKSFFKWANSFVDF